MLNLIFQIYLKIILISCILFPRFIIPYVRHVFVSLYTLINALKKLLNYDIDIIFISPLIFLSLKLDSGAYSINTYIFSIYRIY